MFLVVLIYTAAKPEPITDVWRENYENFGIDLCVLSGFSLHACDKKQKPNLKARLGLDVNLDRALTD